MGTKEKKAVKLVEKPAVKTLVKPSATQEMYWKMDDMGVAFCLGCGARDEAKFSSDAKGVKCQKCGKNKVTSVFEMFNSGELLLKPAPVMN